MVQVIRDMTARPTIHQTGSFTAAVGNKYTIDNRAGAATVTLPSAVVAGLGAAIEVDWVYGATGNLSFQSGAGNILCFGGNLYTVNATLRAFAPGLYGGRAFTLVSDGTNWLMGLDDATEAWTTVALANSLSGTAFVRKESGGTVVRMRASINRAGNTVGAPVTAFTIPAGYRPLQSKVGFAWGLKEALTQEGYVTSGGVVSWATTINSQDAYCDASWAVV